MPRKDVIGLTFGALVFCALVAAAVCVMMHIAP